MDTILKYKGYIATASLTMEAEKGKKVPIIHGKIEGIDDLVTFECDDLSKLESEFHKAVDDYIDFCKEVGKNPEKEYKGLFNVRIAPQTHRILARTAIEHQVSLNNVVESALDEYIHTHDLTKVS